MCLIIVSKFMTKSCFVRVCRTSEELMLYLGCKLGYWRGDIKGLVDDIGTVNSLCDDCFGYQTNCRYIELSLLRGTAAVRKH